MTVHGPWNFLIMGVCTGCGLAGWTLRCDGCSGWYCERCSVAECTGTPS